MTSFKKEIKTDNIITFVAKANSMTKRGVQMMQKNSNERFEREAMGALMQNAGYTINELCLLMTKHPKLFDFRETVEKLKLIDNFENILGGSFKRTEMYSPHGTAKVLIGFLGTYFKDYTNELDGKLHFEYMPTFDTVIGLKTGEYIIVKAVDITSTTVYPTSKLNIPIISTSYETAIDDIDTIINLVKKDFKDYSENTNKKKDVEEIELEIKIEVSEKYPLKKDGIMGNFYNELSKEKDISFIIKQSISYEDINFTLMDIRNNLVDSDTYIKVGSQELTLDYDRLKNALNVIEFTNKVIKEKGFLNDKILEPLISKLFEAHKTLKESIEKEEVNDIENQHIYELTSKIFNRIFNLVKPNLDKVINLSIDAVFKNSLRIDIDKKELNDNWICVKDNLYTKTFKVDYSL